ncbi:MAG: disulfide bond formation protein B [Pseudomonadota bacterium]
MSTPIDPLLKSWHWPAISLSVAILLLAGAHAFERFALLLPCPLCLRQREVYWAVIAMTLTALALWRVRQNPRFMTAFNVMLGLVFVTGTVVAGYHAGVEWQFWPAPTGCGDGGDIDIMSIDLSNLDSRQATMSCEDAPWVFLGLSLAGWNTLISLAMAAISFRAAGVSFPRGRLVSPAE